MTSCRYSRWQISAILDFTDPIMGSLKSPCMYDYRSIDTIALNCLVFGENRVFLQFGDRQRDKQTNRRTDRQDTEDSTDTLSRSRCRERQLNRCFAIVFIIFSHFIYILIHLLWGSSLSAAFVLANTQLK